jgi:hypothetical protein
MKNAAPLIVGLLVSISLVASGFSSGPSGSLLADPDIWTDPTDYDFVVEIGQSDTDNLTVGNNGTADLNYVIMGAESANDVLVLDGATAGSTNAIDGLTAAGFDVTNAGQPHSYNGNPNPANFDLVVLLVGDDYTLDMPNGGQAAIESYVRNGGNIIMTEWVGFHVQNGRYNLIAPMVPMTRTAGNHAIETCTVLMSHPITDGIPSPFTTVHHSFGVMNAKAGTTVVVHGNMANDEVAFRSYLSGMVVHFATVGRYSTYDAWIDPDLLQLLLNSANWMTDNGTVTLPEWLTITPGNGILSPTETADHVLVVNTTTLTPGHYYYNITIVSNDPDENPFFVPIHLHAATSHDVAVSDMTTREYPATLEPLWINGTIHNEGLQNETMVVVQLQINFILENFTVIPSLNSMDYDTVTFLWTPMIESQYMISLFASPIPGETIGHNNWINRTVNVTDQPDIWVSPMTLNFTVASGQTTSGDFTVGNEGLADLTYEIDLPMIHYWELDEKSGTTAYDSTGNIHGTVHDAIIGQPGKVHESYWFDGTNDYVEFDDDDSLDFNTGEDFSVYAWINTTVNNVRFISKRQVPGDARGYLMFIENNNLGVYLDLGTSGALLRGGAVITDGQWHHVGFARSGNTLEAFVDGNSIGSRDDAAGDLRNDNPLLFGVEQDITLDYTGYIDDIRMYNKAVHPAELMSRGSGVGWLSVSPDSGIIAPLGSANHTVTINATNLYTGYYQAYISVLSNDTNEAAIEILVMLTVTDPDSYGIALSEGWNLISFPLIQSDESLDNVLRLIDGKWDQIQIYDPLAPENWKSKCTFKPGQLNDFDSISHKNGFWINITEPGVNLTITGYEPVSVDIPLYAGWNLVGYPSLTTSTVYDALFDTGYDAVEGFNATAPYRISPLGDTYVMNPGEAFWVHVPADTVWTVDW